MDTTHILNSFPMTIGGIIITDWIIAFSSIISLIAIVKLFMRDKQKENQIFILQEMTKELINNLNFEKRKRKRDVQPHLINPSCIYTLGFVKVNSLNIGKRAYNVNLEINQAFNPDGFIIEKHIKTINESETFTFKMSRPIKPPPYGPMSDCEFEVEIQFGDIDGITYLQKFSQKKDGNIELSKPNEII